MKLMGLSIGLSLVVALFVPLMSSADTQTPSVTLETVISVIQGNPHIADKHLQVLSAFLSTAIEQGAISPEQALQLLDIVGWTELADEDALGFAARALELALIAVTAEGAAYDEVLTKLAEMAESGKLGPFASEEHAANALPGLATALLKSTQGLTPELMEGVEEAVLAGVPPGQVIQTIKALTRAGAEEEEILEALEGLTEDVEHGPGAKMEHKQGQKGGHGGDEELGSGNEDQDDEELESGPGDQGESEGHGPPPGRGKSDDEDDEEHEGHGHGHGHGGGKKG